MKRLPLLALVLASLIVPATTLADEPANRAWQVTAITMGGTRTAISGKLSITNGTNLGASAGCNSIGARVKLDGNVVTILGPAAMTEMACPGFNGQAEELLLKILGAGRFTITPDKWTSAIGDIEVTELPAPDPGAPGVPPDQPIGGCVNIVVPDGGPGGGTDGSAPDAGSGSGSGFGSSGSGGAAATGGVTEPAPAPTPAEVPCAPGVIGGGKVDPGTTAIGEPEFAIDTARDVLFVPLAIGFGILVLVTIVLLVRGPRAAKPEATEQQ